VRAKAFKEPDIPQDLDAEAAVLGCVFIDPGKLDDLKPLLRAGDFWLERHRVIFEAMCEVASRGDEPDIVSVCDCLRSHGHLERAGGAALVMSLSNLVPHSAGAIQWAHILLKHSARRAMFDLSRAYAQASLRDDAEAVAEIEHLQARLDEINSRRQGEPRHEDRGKLAYFPIMTDVEIQELQPARGIVGDILFEDSIAYLFGDSDTWKTFVAISMGLCIATGRDWLGREVVQGPVIYIAAESARGIGKRIKAWKLYHRVSDRTDFYTVPVPVNMLSRDAIARLILSIRAFPQLANRNPLMIVFDTLSRSMEDGDENSTADANKVTSAAGMLKAEFGCCVLILHHNGKDASRGMRGNSAYRNNADTVIKVVAPAVHEDERRQPGDPVTLRSVKAKENDPFEDVMFTAQRYIWTIDEAGTTDDSLVVMATEKTTGKRKLPFTDNQRQALLALSAAKEPLTSAKWQEATGIPERSFYVVRRELCSQGYATEETVGRNKFYAISESGRAQIGAKGESAPIAAEIGANTEEISDEIGAAEGDTLYTPAPLHLSHDPEVWGDDDAHMIEEVS
jgi:AAA domain-containing protein/DnaB helicase-like protein